MNLADFVALLELDWAVVGALASAMSVGVLAFVQALKVFHILQTPERTGQAALIIAGVEGSLVVAGYFFPVFVPVGLIIYATAIAASAAGLGYQYLAKPLVKAFFKNALLSSDELNPPTE